MDRIELLREIQEKTELSFSRSGGPGGQNVNKRDTRVTARLLVENLVSPGEAGRMRIRRRLSGRINSEGYIVLHADGERSQLRNREDAVSRMEELVAGALRPDPRPRKATRPTRAAKERRLGSKKIRGRVKDGRRGSGFPDD
jgi:ribosome-associated protein